MEEILVRAGCFIAIIALGCILRQTGVLGPDAVKVLSKIVLRITLPAAIVFNFAGKPIDISLLLVTLTAFGGAVVLMIGGYLSRLRRSRADKAFALLNTTGYNIGSFGLPFAQCFLGAQGVLAASMFDVGGALIGAGGAFSVAQLVKGGKFSVKRLVLTLVKSIPLDFYVIMTVLGLCRISLPGPVVELAEIVGSANGFLAMFTIGVGLRLNINRTQLGGIVGTLAIRLAVAGLLTALCWFVLPFGVEIKKAVTLMAFSPICSPAVPYTAELEGDVGLAGALNTVSLFCSIVFMVVLLLLFL